MRFYTEHNDGRSDKGRQFHTVRCERVQPTGLASFGGVLYMVGADNDALYTLNTSTGVASYRTSPPQFAVSEGIPSWFSVP